MTPQPYTFDGEVPSLLQQGGTVTVVEGSTFCLSDRAGDIWPDRPQGLFFLDARFLSRCELTVDGKRPEALTVASDDPYAATFVSRVSCGDPTNPVTLLLLRKRFVGEGMREDLHVRCYADRAVRVRIEYAIDVDFADLFDVKEGRSRSEATRHVLVEGTSGLRFRTNESEDPRDVLVTAGEGAEVEEGRIGWTVDIEPRQEWMTCLQFSVGVYGEQIEPRYRCGVAVDHAEPSVRMANWRRRMPKVRTDHGPLAMAVARAGEDLGSLRLYDPDFPNHPVLAAGAPWFMTLFGRDSLISAWMALVVDGELVEGVLETLARLAGTTYDPETEEQPGKILHEVRFMGARSRLSLNDADRYYGTVDATPLFVMLLGELHRWGLAPDTCARLLTHADAAIRWMIEDGDRDGDGYLEYERSTSSGLENQGWKDSWDAIRFADGSFATGPIALCEVQAYFYAALVARAQFAIDGGDREHAESLMTRATALKEAFNRDFWMADQGTFALALDGDKRQVDSVTSNAGHCLWAGIVDEDKAPLVARRLLADDSFSGWGIRTMATTMVAYDPLSYHNGSVWPHDNAICAAGMARYGLMDEALQVIGAQLDVAGSARGRLPELFAGIERSIVGEPVAYPTSCSPQAWAAAGSLLYLRTLLRLDPWIDRGVVWIDPVLPPGVRFLRIEGIPLAESEVTVTVDGDSFEIENLPPGITVIRGTRPPLADLVRDSFDRHEASPSGRE